MTKKDYKLIAKALSIAANKTVSLIGWQNAKDEIIKALEQDNPKFDKEKFLDFVEEGIRKQVRELF